MQNHSFSGQIVMITGASGNLGTSITKQFLSSGANLVLIDHGLERLNRIFPEIIESDEHLVVQGIDINDESILESVVNNAIDKFRRIDVLVNTVGGYRGGSPLYETSYDTWKFLFDLNALPVYNLAIVVTPFMLEAKSGKIINIAARLALRGSANNAAYSAVKSVVVRLTEGMAAELINEGINVNCVLPGTIDTPQNRASMPNADYSRWVTPDAIADVILFLASDAARAVTGASIPVYGRS